MNLTTIAWIVGVILTISTWGTVYRIWKGPSLLDRVLASDVLLSIITSALCIIMIVTDTEYSIILLVAIALIGFVGSVTVARFADNSKADEATPITTVERHRRSKNRGNRSTGHDHRDYHAEDTDKVHHSESHPSRASMDQGE
ncbi:monovalent cation/H+ antiporter complex subunit F [Rothia sp. LK2492]|mgnify:FL=1|uniref:monovalent cation/H+ antiporter complex subunit F n=1 Tax=Rothia sp. LK2492 TaxID=3114370 RepID=UPI0034CD42BB